MISITDSAQTYLLDLLQKQEEEGISIRIFVADAGTPSAETCIAYCRPGEENEDDECFEYSGFNAWIELKSHPFLEGAVVDYSEDRMGGQLTIKAPNAKTPRLNEDSSIEERINYILHSEINPGLASHGGVVNLIEVANEVAVLQFGGGCQGCGMVDTTLKDGVEKTLLDSLPQLKGVRDVTDHSVTENAYF
jgi:Fe/S biogenesis protein NfuA